MFAAAVLHFGSIDIVCPGAGVWEPEWSSFWVPPGSEVSRDGSLGDRYGSIDINVTHPSRVSQLAIPHFLSMSPPPSPSNPKSIVLVTSIAGESATIFWPPYTSKHAINGFVRCFSGFEETHGIRVSAVAPGMVLTPIFTDDLEKMKTINMSEDKVVTVDEVAEVMLALVKDTTLDRPHA